MDGFIERSSKVVDRITLRFHTRNLWADGRGKTLIAVVFGWLLSISIGILSADDMLGTGLGALWTVFLVIGAMSPLLFGAVADWGYFDEASFGLAALAGVMLWFILRMPND